MSTDRITELLEGLANAARNDRKAEFDRLERELLTNFDGSFDAMPPDVYQQYLAVDRLWPVISPSAETALHSARNALRVNLPAGDETWLRQLGADVDRSLSAVLAACLAVIREDERLRAAVERRLERPSRAD